MDVRHHQRALHQVLQLPRKQCRRTRAQALQLALEVGFDEGLLLGRLAVDRMRALMELGGGKMCIRDRRSPVCA